MRCVALLHVPVTLRYVHADRLRTGPSVCFVGAGSSRRPCRTGLPVRSGCGASHAVPSVTTHRTRRGRTPFRAPTASSRRGPGTRRTPVSLPLRMRRQTRRRFPGPSRRTLRTATRAAHEPSDESVSRRAPLREAPGRHDRERFDLTRDRHRHAVRAAGRVHEHQGAPAPPRIRAGTIVRRVRLRERVNQLITMSAQVQTIRGDHATPPNREVCAGSRQPGENHRHSLCRFASFCPPPAEEPYAFDAE